MEPLTVFLLYSLRFSVNFLVVVLWVVAVSDIGSRVRKGSFTAARLTSMTVAISVVAVVAIAALNAVVPSHGWIGIGSRKSASVPSTSQECEAFSYTFTYSFGLRQPTSVPGTAWRGLSRTTSNRAHLNKKTAGAGR
jgi:hypothetical protein